MKFILRSCITQFAHQEDGHIGHKYSHGLKPSRFVNTEE